MQPQSLPSGRFRAIAWDSTLKRKVTIRCPYNPKGTWDSYEDAAGAIKAYEVGVDEAYLAAGVALRRQRRQVRFDDYAWQWLAAQQHGRYEQNTLRKFRHDILALIRFFPEQHVDEITRTAVNAVFADAANHPVKKRALGTRQGWATRLRKIMRSAMNDRLRDDDPTADISVKMARTYDGVPITDQQLLEACVHLPGWCWPMALLAHDAGMRAAEIGGLDWGHLDLRDVGAAWVSIGPVIEKDGTIRPYPKGGKELPVALTTRTAVALRELRAKYPGRSTDLVFRNPRRDTPLSLGSIGDYWRRARMFAGLTNPAVKFHHLRHACAERLADAGTDIRLIQGVLRHANIATTQIYLSRVTDLDAQRAALHRAAELSSEPDDPEAND